MTRDTIYGKGVVNAIFGAELPQEQCDPHDLNSDDDGTLRDQWLQENIPPHHR